MRAANIVFVMMKKKAVAEVVEGGGKRDILQINKVIDIILRHAIYDDLEKINDKEWRIFYENCNSGK